jgi:Tfp pilus assembly protein PilF
MKLSNLIRLAFLFLALVPSALAQSGSEERSKEAESIALTNLAFGYAKSGQYTKAVQELKQAVRLKPDLAEAHYFLGVTYNNMGQHEAAIESC